MTENESLMSFLRFLAFPTPGNPRHSQLLSSSKQTFIITKHICGETDNFTKKEKKTLIKNDKRLDFTFPPLFHPLQKKGNKRKFLVQKQKT
jgi:hypothetical protein